MKNRDKLLNRINAYSDVELGTFMYHHNISTNDDNNVEDWSDTDYTHWLTQESELSSQEKEQQIIDKFRNATKEEQNAIYNYVIRTSKPTGINIFDTDNDKTADEMFSELGYKRYLFANNTVEYITCENITIQIDFNSHNVGKFYVEYIDAEAKRISCPIDIKERKAINKLFQELGEK